MSHTSLPVIRSLWQFGTRGWACAACLYSRNSSSIVPLWHPSHPTALPHCPHPVPEETWSKQDSENQLYWNNGVPARFLALYQDKAMHFHPTMDEIISACEAVRISMHGFFTLSIIIWLLFFFKMCTASTNFSPPLPFTAMLLKHVPELNYLCSAERCLSPSEKQSSFQPVQQEAYLLSPFQGGEKLWIIY